MFNQKKFEKLENEWYALKGFQFCYQFYEYEKHAKGKKEFLKGE